jgi:hypothetical protein
MKITLHVIYFLPYGYEASLQIIGSNFSDWWAYGNFILWQVAASQEYFIHSSFAMKSVYSVKLIVRLFFIFFLFGL